MYEIKLDENGLPYTILFTRKGNITDCRLSSTIFTNLHVQALVNKKVQALTAATQFPIKLNKHYKAGLNKLVVVQQAQRISKFNETKDFLKLQLQIIEKFLEIL
uniref:Uncharacterized protein n=1 Tax=Glossina pallidipes TaxID=7398 RepID=A0A1B0A2N6_GLOPL